MEFPVATEHFIDLQILYDLPIYVFWFSISSIVVMFINMTHAANLDKYLCTYLPIPRFLLYVLFDFFLIESITYKYWTIPMKIKTLKNW